MGCRDTAFALGMLALVGPRCPDRLRAFLLTVVDDVVALLVIATAYSESIALRPLLVAIGLFAIVLTVRALGIRRGVAYVGLGAASWVALVDSGVDPVVVGLAMGLLTVAYPVPAISGAADAELARQARAGMEAALSPNDRAAAAQGAFWAMHDLLFAQQDALRFSDLLRYAAQLRLDVERFTDDLHRRVGAARVASDVESADLSGVSGTPTFFINGRRHFGAFDIETRSARYARQGREPSSPHRPHADRRPVRTGRRPVPSAVVQRLACSPIVQSPTQLSVIVQVAEIVEIGCSLIVAIVGEMRQNRPVSQTQCL